jgi:hypothetical protein
MGTENEISFRVIVGFGEGTYTRFPARRAFTNAFACATVCGSNFTINLLTLVVIAGSPFQRLPGVEKAGATLLF